MAKMVFVALVCVLVCTLQFASAKKYTDVPCEWKSKTGDHYNLKPLIIAKNSASYYIKDGDIPCTPETEPNFNYVWNFCSDVTEVSVPNICTKLNKKGPVLQWMEYGSLSDCYVIGRYDPKQDDLSYSLLDPSDPTKGVSMSYPAGDSCHAGTLRTTTLDVQCENTPLTVVSAQEPRECNYHLVMKSYYGCPTECPVTKNGLCSSHGLCMYDKKKSQSYCYCNEGYGGADCSGPVTEATTYDGYSVQLGLLITLLLVALALVGVVGFLVYRVTMLRKEHASDYNALPHGSEMVETVHF